MKESPTPTPATTHQIGGGGDDNRPGQAITQEQDQQDNALEAAAKSPVRNAPKGSPPGPSTDPEGAPINQGQVSPHDTSSTSTTALNKTVQIEGGEAEADPAARPKGKHGTPAKSPLKTSKPNPQTSTIGAEEKDVEPATPVSKDTPNTTNTAPTGPPASSSASEQRAPEDRTGGSPAPPANPDPNQGSTAELVSSGTPKANRNLAPQFDL